MIFVHKQFAPSVVSVWLLVILSAQSSRGDDPAVAERVPRTIRSTAIVDFSFEEPNGDARDGELIGKIANGTRRVPSPFWGQSGGKAILLNAGRKQLVQIADGPKTDRPDAVSVSLFFLSLHPLSDAAFHGVFAKRAESNAGAVTNFGINYRPNGDALQLYINDGGGFRSVVYSVKDAINARRLAHLTATWEVGDAPAPDADPDPDDVRVRLFLNGKPVTPKSAANGQISGIDGWMLDINVAKLLNDVPLSIGSSTLSTEFTSGVVDEFLLFDRALNTDDALKLFREVAGPHAEDLARKESQPQAAAVPGPRITQTSLHGLEAGRANKLSVSGTNLGPNPRIVIPRIRFEQSVEAGSNAGRLNVGITLPGDSPVGWFPLYVETDHGLSPPVGIAIDRLTQMPAAGTSPEKPAELPAAFSGQITGAGAARIYFRGKAGDRVAAEVEAKRLGSAFDPVVEIKTERGTPLKIGWSETALRGDARAEVRLPDDGLYFVELHDLTYKAPGQNRFRLRVGDFASIDQWFPARLPAGENISLTPVGAGLPADSSLLITGSNLPVGQAMLPRFLADWKAVGPAPPLALTQAIEILETDLPDDLQQVDATFQKQPHLPTAINGIVSKPGEEDRYLLDVTPGQKLRFVVEARSLPSPLDALFTVRNHPQGNVLVYKEDSGTDRDPETDFTVPANVKQIQVGVADLHEKGGGRFVYRLMIAPANAPDFSLEAKSSFVSLPAAGSAVVEMTLTRRGYAGPIKLRVSGDEAVSVIPEEIPAGKGNRDLFVTLVRKGDDRSRGFRGLTIFAESVGLEPELIRPVKVASPAGMELLAGQNSLLAARVTASAPFQVNPIKLPAALFKGVPANVTVGIQQNDRGATAESARLTLLTTEPVRPNDPKDPKKGNKPKIRAPEYQAVETGTEQGTLRITVPLDVAVAEIDAVIKAELVPHAYSDKVSGTVYSAPFKLPVKSAAEVTLDQKSFSLTAGEAGTIKGVLKRNNGFNGPVTITPEGLPKGYQAGEVTVPKGTDAFEIPITPAKENAAKTIKANLSVKLAGRGNILPNLPVELKIAPAK